MGIIRENGWLCKNDENTTRMEIAALVVGSIAILMSGMALPAAFQMFWGGPLVRFGFSEYDAPEGRRLLCEISSVPIRNRLLQKCGVRREPAIISARFRIYEAGGNHVAVDTTQAQLVEYGDSGNKGSLRATVVDNFGVNFVCVMHLKDNNHANAVDLFKEIAPTLARGRYRVDIEVVCGHKVFSRSREMTVGVRLAQTYWVPSPPND